MIRCRLVPPVVAFLLFAGGAFPCFAADQPAGVGDTSTAEVQRCVEAHDNARVLMLQEKWLEAREGMMRCQDAACPLAVRSDCAAWLEEVTRILPTLLVVVERDDDGKARVELVIDGKTIELPNPPAPIEVLPGTHLVRVNLPPYAPVERVVVLGKGEKNHVVRVRFAREPEPVPPAPPPSAASKPEPARPVQPLTYALAGGAVAAFATSGILLASALSARDEALDRCAPNCAESERDSIDARLLAADIVGAAGIVLGGFAVYTFVTRPTEEVRAFTPKLGITQAGPTFFIEGQF